MFGSIKKAWQEARGTELLKEVEQIVGMSGTFSPASWQQFVEGYVLINHAVERTYGDVTNLSSELRKSIAKELTATARKHYDLNVGKSCGTFLVAAKLEAMSLPGEDAKSALMWVEQLEETLLDAAKEASEIGQ